MRSRRGGWVFLWGKYDIHTIDAGSCPSLSDPPYSFRPVLVEFMRDVTLRLYIQVQGDFHCNARVSESQKSVLPTGRRRQHLTDKD